MDTVQVKSRMKDMQISAEMMGEGLQEEESKFEKWLAEKLKINIMSVITTLSLILGLGLAVLLFMYLPQLGRQGLESLFSTKFDVWAKSFIEGGIKLAIFVKESN